MVGVSPLQAVSSDLFPGIHLSVLRLDLIDSFGSGNKFFKLKYNLERARAEGLKRLISFGGAYSNHIHALALMGAAEGFETVGLIRGEPTQPLNETLHDAKCAGMDLHYLSRQDYRRRHEPEFLEQLERRFPDCFWLPEGGSNLQGVRGCLDIGPLLDQPADLVMLACGTAATMAGVAAACPAKSVCGISVLKGAAWMQQQVENYLEDLKGAGFIAEIPDNWWLEHDYHCGGYAKLEPGLVNFIAQFEQSTNIPVDPVYTGKVFYALYQMVAGNKILPGSKVTVVHTGGLQGVRGLREKLCSMWAAS